MTMSGLKLDVRKSEYFTTVANEAGSIVVYGAALVRTRSYNCVASAIASDGSLTFEVNSRVSGAWFK